MLDMGPMASQRRDLPVYAFKDLLLSTIEKNLVTVVEGETGSGKTTQVPQFCLEHAASQNLPCNIIVAQPRRISAMSVAERVSLERGDTRVGTSVGYTIRLESKASADTRLLFCTTGILLKRLEEDVALENVTHVFVDEVHERSIESDFLLMVLKDLLLSKQQQQQRSASSSPQALKRVPPPLRLILMSATLDARLFGDYFGGAPSVKFPGRTFPVKELYLEDVLEVTQHKVRGHEDWCHNNKGKEKSTKSTEVKKKKKKKGNSTEVKKGRLLEEEDDMLLTPAELHQRYATYSISTQNALAKLDPDAINYDLVVETIIWLSSLPPSKGCVDQKNDDVSSSSSSSANNNNKSNKAQQMMAILVFLPGIKEISTLEELLVKSLQPVTTQFWVLPLHSTTAPEDQRRVFSRPPLGVRKIVLSTNIAETAITIDDVGFVVDTGRMKETQYDPSRRMSSLEGCLVSRANARQRRGRAGRVGPGVAVHLFTRHRHDHIAAPSQVPEIQRVPLEQLVLRIKALGYRGSVSEVCLRLIEPPMAETVERAVNELVTIGALVHLVDSGIGCLSISEEEKEEIETKTTEHHHHQYHLTALGVHLSRLPVDCRIGKLCLFGAMFGVTDDALTIAATLSLRSPFLSPVSRRDEADAAKLRFATADSDHLSALNAYKQVDKLGSGRYEFCRENFLSIKTFQTIAGLKRQFLELLSAAGFVRPNLNRRAVEALGRRHGGCDGVALALARGVTHGKKSHNNNKVKAAYAAPGDWKCSACRVHNFARNVQKCFRCKALKPQTVEALDLVEVPDLEPQRALLNGEEEEEVEENSIPLLKALLVAALFPQVVTVEESQKGSLTLKAKIEKGTEKNHEDIIALHPSCITGKSKGALSSKYLVYHEMVQTTRIFIRDATPVSPYALLLFGGGRIDVEACPRGSHENVLRLDGWIGFKCQRKDHLLVMELRQVLDGILRHKVENPKKDFTEEAEGIIDAVKALLTMDEDGKVMMAPEKQDPAFKSKKTGKGGRGKGSRQNRR